MDPVLTASAMKAADTQTIERFGIPGFTLMETAGRAVAREVQKHLAIIRSAPGESVLCACGVGNNAGDGFVVARTLVEAGIPVRVVLAGNPERLPPDAARNLELLRSLVSDGGRVVRDKLAILEFSEDTASIPAEACLIVDALLGTGISGPAREPIASWIEAINESRAHTIAIDVPSGLSADDGTAQGAAVRADATVTMAAAKTGHVLNEGPGLTGDLIVVPIGIPPHILQQASTKPGCGSILTRSDVTVPVRSPNAHKYSSGLLVTVCGSPGLTGAAVMSAHAAMRVGAGAVVCATGSESIGTLAERFTEVMTVELPESELGLVPDAAVKRVSESAAKAAAVLIGCGLGRATGTIATVKQLLQTLSGTVVLDADGLYAMSDAPDLLRESSAELILTPHRGEFERLTGEPANWDDRIELARRHAAAWNCVLVLKGQPSVVGLPDGRVFVAPGASRALATAGAGDVLAGMIAGLAAQGLSATDAALSALYVGWYCANRYESRFAPQTMMATDIVEQLPEVMQDLIIA